MGTSVAPATVMPLQGSCFTCSTFLSFQALVTLLRMPQYAAISSFKDLKHGQRAQSPADLQVAVAAVQEVSDLLTVNFKGRHGDLHRIAICSVLQGMFLRCLPLGTTELHSAACQQH